MSDDRQGRFQDGQQPSPGAPQGEGGSRSDRLPPPAFPPGQRAARRNHRPEELRSSRAEDDAADEGGVPDEAFISPDEPIVRSSLRVAEGAFISPDEPIPQRGGAKRRRSEPEGVVTGIGDDPHLGEEDLVLVRHGDPAVAELARRVARLADALRDRGEAGLRTTPDMSRFEATLRAYCVGYLASQREGPSE